MLCPLLFAGPPAEDLSVFSPASPPAVAIRSLFFLVLAVSLGILLVVEGVLIYSLVRFRRRPTDPATEPPQVYGSMPIEIAWTVAPALIVFVFVLGLARTEYKAQPRLAEPPPNAEPLYVTVVGHQWWWEYAYDRFGDQEIRDADGNRVITANELRVPVSDDGTPRPVYLTLQSADVAHSFWVPRLAGKIDLIPGRTNRLWFQTDQAGLYLGQCAEYCGTQHAHMLLRVNVLPIKEFREWLRNEIQPAANDEQARRGRDVFLRTACVNCHRVRGTAARGTFGPDLTHLMRRDRLASGMVPNNAEQLRKWVEDPQSIKPGCNMPAMKLSEGDVGLVVRYLLSLK